jgi:hypothetical protein
VHLCCGTAAIFYKHRQYKGLPRAAPIIAATNIFITYQERRKGRSMKFFQLNVDELLAQGLKVTSGHFLSVASFENATLAEKSMQIDICCPML